jgi:hypothetical protein
VVRPRMDKRHPTPMHSEDFDIIELFKSEVFPFAKLYSRKNVKLALFFFFFARALVK